MRSDYRLTTESGAERVVVVLVQSDREQKRLIRMAETISKALPYMRRHNDATFVVKYGGHAMTDPKLGDLVAHAI